MCGLRPGQAPFDVLLRLSFAPAEVARRPPPACIAARRRTGVMPLSRHHAGLPATDSVEGEDVADVADRQRPAIGGNAQSFGGEVRLEGRRIPRVRRRAFVGDPLFIFLNRVISEGEEGPKAALPAP